MECPSFVTVCGIFLMLRLSLCISGWNITKVTLCHPPQDTNDAYLSITSDVNLDHFIKVVSAKFLHGYVTIVHFIINTYFVRIYLEYK